MESNLLERTVKELMDKFGAGSHKPGSGSAAAFQAMVSAKLISTVISLSTEEKRRHLYSDYILELSYFQEQIEKRIYPELTKLFQSDSEQFDKTIKLRKARDKEKDEVAKNSFRRQALEELKISIDIPFQIASLCKEMAKIGSFVFDNGFKSARGDSQVGISGAVSALAGCIAIIRLNILSFNSDEYQYSKSIVSSVNILDKEYQRLNDITNLKVRILADEFDRKIPLFEGINNLINKSKSSRNIKIEDCVRELQNLIWLNKHLIWKKNIPKNEFEILHPDYILKKVLGYNYFSSSDHGVLTEDEKIIEVAGVIDQSNMLVMVSNKFSFEVQRSTSAHELGHAILHEKSVLHRDIPADSPEQRKTRDFTEIQADKFASYFLMPKKIVLREFQDIFSSNLFEINEDSAFQFGGKNVKILKKECKNLRELSRKIASTETFNFKYFDSLAKRFKVSIEAMAIRLEELGMVKY